MRRKRGREKRRRREKREKEEKGNEKSPCLPSLLPPLPLSSPALPSHFLLSFALVKAFAAHQNSLMTMSETRNTTMSRNMNIFKIENIENY